MAETVSCDDLRGERAEVLSKIDEVSRG